MQCTLVGREHIAGKKDNGQEYDFIKLYIAGERKGVEGQATDVIFLYPDSAPVLCERVMKALGVGERVEILYSREIGSKREVVSDIIQVPPLAVVEDEKNRRGA